MVKRRDETFQIEFYEGILRRNPTQIDALRQIGHLYTRIGRIREGLKADLVLALLCPRDAVAQYNLACSYSLLADLEKAFVHLEEAMHLGYRDLEHLQGDSDLALLRQDPRFAALLSRFGASGNASPCEDA